MDREELSNTYGQIMFSLSQVLNQQQPLEMYFESLSDDKKRFDENKLREELLSLSLYNNVRKRTINNLFRDIQRRIKNFQAIYQKN